MKLHRLGSPESIVARIVTTAYRPKRPRKRKAVAIAGPAIVRKRSIDPAKPLVAVKGFPEEPGNDDRKPAPPSDNGSKMMQPAIVTARRPGARRIDVSDLTPEEYQRRGDAADALWRELVRRATSKDRP
jgi:hypothetical protein